MTAITTRSLAHCLIFVWFFATFMFGIQFLPRNPWDNADDRQSNDLPRSIFSTMTSSNESSADDDNFRSMMKFEDAAPRFPEPEVRNRTGWTEYFRFRNTGSGRIWPKIGEDEDRILNQLHLTKSDSTDDKFKKIFLYEGLEVGLRPGRGRFLDHRCPVNRCLVTGDARDAASADAVLFRDFVSETPFLRRPDQIWILFLLESAVSRHSIRALNDKINWTATYRTDSTLVTPYERFSFFANYSGLPDKAPRNFAAGKTRKVAWIVSNCHAANGRHNYVEELRKYIEVDIFGSCGSLECVRGSKECQRKLRQYKFYLAFENSNCVDYITEKMYWNSFGRNLSDPNDVVPVVMGARPEDYARLAPPMSYIHVDDFESPKHLAEYLHQVDADDHLFNSYFRWKGTGDYIDTKFWCRLCALIHEANRSKRHMTFNNVDDWWRGDGVCVHPQSSEGWASWRKDTPGFNHSGNYFTSWVEK